MKIESFREILLRKSLDNKDLSLTISSMSKDILLQYVNESLEKMASLKGLSKKTNPIVVNFANDVATNGNLPKMMYDHLSHHATRYKAALKAGNKDVAGQHMRKIFNNLYLTQKMIHDGDTNHTGGAIDHNSTKWVDPKPWERHRYSVPGPSGKLSDTTGIKRNYTSAPFYDFLEKAPHHLYSEEVHSHGHNKAWPLEETMFNGKYIHIDDNHEPKKYFEPHIFDSHPIMDYNTIGASPGSVNAARESEYENKAQNFYDTHLSGNYVPMHVSNPDLGSSKSSQVHADVEPLDTSHIASQIASRSPSAAKAQPGQKVSKPSSIPITPEHISTLVGALGEDRVKEILGEDTYNQVLGKK